jgi:hypothetical protein
MAVTITSGGGRHFAKKHITFTADGTATISFDRPVRRLSFTSDGVDGGGTLTWKVSNNSADFSAFGACTSADPANATAVTSATAAGNWQTMFQLGTYDTYQFILAGATGPTLVLDVYAELL